MSDLIDRQQAIEAITDELDKIDHVPQWVFNRIEKAINKLPSAEPKIIHCEDCKFGMLDPSFPYQWFCKFKGDEWNNNDYFCGHARKREVAT